MIKITVTTVLVLGIFFYPLLTTQDGLDVENPVICSIAGSSWSKDVLNINQIPEYCEMIILGQYAFDRYDDKDKFVMETDKGIIRNLVKAEKKVFLPIGFDDQRCDWNAIFDPKNQEEFYNFTINSLVNFINEFKIYGIIINYPNLYYNILEDYAQKINTFVDTVKKNATNLKTGLILPGYNYEYFTNNLIINFKITNDKLDLYIIDLSIINVCDQDTLITGVSPITSTNSNITTIKLVTNSVHGSSMNKTKIYAKIPIAPVKQYKLITQNDPYSILSYYNYCKSTSQTFLDQWCTNPSNLSYYQGAYAKKNYAGIVLDYLDTDDYEGVCECDKFPVSNQIIAGWKGKSFEKCPKLNKC